jgi:hypothetical protein
VLHATLQDGANFLAHWRTADWLPAALYATALAATTVDLLAQLAIIHGLLAAHLGVTLLPATATAAASLAAGKAAAAVSSMVGFAASASPEVMAALLPSADRCSLVSAAVSCVSGLTAEAVLATRALAASERTAPAVVVASAAEAQATVMAAASASASSSSTGEEVASGAATSSAPVVVFEADIVPEGCVSARGQGKVDAGLN